MVNNTRPVMVAWNINNIVIKQHITHPPNSNFQYSQLWGKFHGILLKLQMGETGRQRERERERQREIIISEVSCVGRNLFSPFFFFLKHFKCHTKGLSEYWTQLCVAFGSFWLLPLLCVLQKKRGETREFLTLCFLNGFFLFCSIFQKFKTNCNANT